MVMTHYFFLIKKERCEIEIFGGTDGGGEENINLNATVIILYKFY
jgi:hypothetical protein